MHFGYTVGLTTVVHLSTLYLKHGLRKNNEMKYKTLNSKSFSYRIIKDIHPISVFFAKSTVFAENATHVCNALCIEIFLHVIFLIKWHLSSRCPNVGYISTAKILAFKYSKVYVQNILTRDGRLVEFHHVTISGRNSKLVNSTL